MNDLHTDLNSKEFWKEYMIMKVKLTHIAYMVVVAKSYESSSQSTMWYHRLVTKKAMQHWPCC